MGLDMTPYKAVTDFVGHLGARECGHCSRVYVPKRRAQVYCGPRCGNAAYNASHKVIRAAQRALPGESRVERAFAAWIDTAAGRYVEAEVARLARDDKAAGDRRGEINLYLALVRRSSRHLTLDAQGYRCNNSHRSLLARRLMETRDDLAGYFETRPLRGRVS